MGLSPKVINDRASQDASHPLTQSVDGTGGRECARGFDNLVFSKRNYT